MKKTLYMAALTAAVLSSFSVNVARAADSDDDSLTKYGITFYGLLDVGVAYQNHGAPQNGSYVFGQEWVVSKNSNNSITSVATNGMSVSKLGISGDESFGDGMSAIFKLEMQYNSDSGVLADGPGSVAQNASVPGNQQTSNADSSRQGQIFAGAAYGGIKSDTWGTLTFGRQNALTLDNVLSYDPMGGSPAFSVIGYSGTAGGMGDTEDSRLDSSLKYVNKFGMIRLAGLVKLGGQGGGIGNVYEADLGTDMNGFSIDAGWHHINNAVAAVAGAAVGSLTANVSDNTAETIAVKYTTGALKAMAGFEHIGFNNPGQQFTTQNVDLGGSYIATVINNAAYNNSKELNYFWAGLNYGLTSTATVMAAWYHVSQNSYAGNGCTDTSSAACSGAENAYSLVLDNTYNKHVDTYVGAMLSANTNGLAAAYLNSTSLDAMVGMRVRF